MATIRSFHACIIILTTFIVSLSGFKIFDARADVPVGEILTPARRSDPGLIKEDGLISSFRSEPIFEQGILRRLKRTSYDYFREESTVPIPTEENDQEEGKTKFFVDKKNGHFHAGVLRSGLPEGILRSIRSTLIPKNPYDGLPLRYLTMINGK